MGQTCTGQCTVRSKNRPIPSSEYAPYLSHDMFGINFDSKSDVATTPSRFVRGCGGYVRLVFDCMLVR